MIKLFIISFIALILFSFWKIFEEKFNKKIISPKVFSKSDNFIYSKIGDLDVYYKNISNNFSNSPNLLKNLSKKVLISIGNHKDKIAGRIKKSVEEKRHINRNKGSVSLFLKNISEDKKDN